MLRTLKGGLLICATSCTLTPGVFPLILGKLKRCWLHVVAVSGSGWFMAREGPRLKATEVVELEVLGASQAQGAATGTDTTGLQRRSFCQGSDVAEQHCRSLRHRAESSQQQIRAN